MLARAADTIWQFAKQGSKACRRVLEQDSRPVFDAEFLDKRRTGISSHSTASLTCHAPIEQAQPPPPPQHPPGMPPTALIVPLGLDENAANTDSLRSVSPSHSGQGAFSSILLIERSFSKS
jgi:hypothetical protein